MAEYNHVSIIKSIVGELKISLNAFANGMGIPYDRMYSIVRRGKSIPNDVIESISKTYHVNTHYLRTGLGKMFEEPEEVVVNSEDELTQGFLRCIAILTNENKLLKQKVEELEKKIQELEK